MQKKTWQTPAVITYGNVAALTLAKCKDPGLADDFGVSGISDATDCTP